MQTEEGGMDDVDRLPVEDVLKGLTIHPLEDEAAKIDFVFFLVRYKDEGGTGWVYRTSGTPNREELLGALQIQVDLLRRELLDEWS